VIFERCTKVRSLFILTKELLAYTSLLIAAKFMELDDRIPLISELEKLSKFKYTYKQFVACEKKIMQDAVQWNLLY